MLDRRVDLYFQQAGIAKTGNFGMYLKAGLLLAWMTASYYLLVFRTSQPLEGVLYSISLALAMAGVGFNIQHDGNHGSFSKRSWINRLAGLTLDLLGASSHLWIHKHNLSHHTYTNIPEADEDIDLAPMGRLSLTERLRFYHRYQHFYLWFFYTFLVIQWFLYNDFKKLLTGRIGRRTFATPPGRELVILFAGKIVFLSLAIVIPCFLHRWWVVGIFYLGVSMLLGLIISVVFQLAHSVEETGHPQSLQEVRAEWAVHQVQTTADFARANRLLTWYLGGLNFQVVHHLFPRICHVHYPQVARIVEHVCGEFGIKYRAHASFFSAIRSHFRFLKAMGRPPSRRRKSLPVVLEYPS